MLVSRAPVDTVWEEATQQLLRMHAVSIGAGYVYAGNALDRCHHVSMPPIPSLEDPLIPAKPSAVKRLQLRTHPRRMGIARPLLCTFDKMNGRISLPARRWLIPDRCFGQERSRVVGLTQEPGASKARDPADGAHNGCRHHTRFLCAIPQAHAVVDSDTVHYHRYHHHLLLFHIPLCVIVIILTSATEQTSNSQEIRRGTLGLMGLCLLPVFFHS